MLASFLAPFRARPAEGYARPAEGQARPAEAHARPAEAQVRPAEAKASRAAALVAFFGQGRARWSPRDYGSLAREGFLRNAIAYRAVRMVSEAAAR
ncbi:MAG: hypothetical protein B7Z45_05290, partial [Azorhizobium sp. 12-66-6]